jgi:hypothetical protein
MLVPRTTPSVVVSGHAKKRRQYHKKTKEKMNRQANASAKSKELQPITKADTIAAHLLLPHAITTFDI